MSQVGRDLYQMQEGTLRDDWHDQNVYIWVPNDSLATRPGHPILIEKLESPQQVTSLSESFHTLFCGDIGFASAGPVNLWWFHIEGPVVEYIRKVRHNPNAIVLAGYISLSRLALNPTKCILEVDLHTMCLSQGYRNRTLGQQMYRHCENWLKDQVIKPTGECKVIDQVKIRVQTWCNGTEESERIHQKRRKQTRQDTIVAIYPEEFQATSGPWRFWAKLGFEAKSLLNPVIMVKTLQLPVPTQDWFDAADLVRFIEMDDSIPSPPELDPVPTVPTVPVTTKRKHH